MSQSDGRRLAARVALLILTLLAGAAALYLHLLDAAIVQTLLSIGLVALAATLARPARFLLYFTGAVGFAFYQSIPLWPSTAPATAILWLAAVAAAELIACPLDRYHRQVGELAVANHLLRGIIDANPNLILVKNRESRFHLVNTATREFFGKRNEEIIGAGDEALLATPAEVAEFQRSDREVLASGQPIHYPVQRLLDRNRAEHWFQATKVALPVEDGQTEILIVAAEVTDRVLAEHQSRANEQLIRALAEVTAALLASEDIAATLRTGLQLVGDTAEIDQISVYQYDFTTEDDDPTTTCIYAWRNPRLALPDSTQPSRASAACWGRWYHLFRERQPVWARVNDLDPDERALLRLEHLASILALPIYAGEQLWGFVEFDRLHNDALLPAHFVAALAALASSLGAALARQSTRQELERQEQLTSEILRALPDLIYVKDRASRYVTANPAHLALLGAQSVDEIIGKTDFDFFSQESTLPFFSEEQHIMETNTPLLARVEAINIDSPEKKRWVLASKIPLLDRSGAVTGLIVISRDITTLKSTEAALRAAKEAAEAAAAAKSEFLANMSHELRTPLNAVIGMTSLLGDTELSAQQDEYVNTIRIGSEILLAVIDGILDFSKIEAGKLELERHPFSPAQIAQETLRLLAQAAQQKGLTVTATIDATTPAWVLGDPTRLRQVLVNLLNNAIKFTERGEVHVHAQAQPLDSQWRLEFAVRDTGIGIAPDAIGRLFQPFTQVDSSTTRRYGGTGLGLAISRRLVELMGGTIRVASAAGAGSVFSFSVVVDAADADATTTPTMDASTEDPASAPEGRPALRILLAEDNAVNRKVTLRILQRLGYTAEIVTDGVEAVEAAQSLTCDVILMDVHMPKLTGLDATRRIRETLPLARQPYIIGLTADIADNNEQRCMDAGMDAVLFKPVTLEGLADALASVRFPGASDLPAG